MNDTGETTKIQALREIERLDQERFANRITDGPLRNLGHVKNEALDRRLCAEQRRVAIEALGLAPEVIPGSPGDWYAATTGEMICWIKQDLAAA